MNQIPSVIQSFLLDQTLWWCLTKKPKEDCFSASPALQKTLSSSLASFDAFQSCLKPDYVPLLELKLMELLRQKEASRTLVGLSVEGREVWLMMQLQYARIEDEDVICAQCVEVSEMYRLEESLVISNCQLMLEQHQAKELQAVHEAELLQEQYNEQTQFLAMLSHELRSPLLGMASLVAQIKKNQVKGESIDDQLTVIKLTIDQMNFLINDILTYAQTQFNSIKLSATEFELDQMADYVSHLTKSIAQEKGVFVSVSLSAKGQCFLGDVVRVSQILVNLIVNAIKFTKFGGVFVEIKEASESLTFKVTDSGEGIAADELKNIFRPFKQLESDEGKLFVGAGLGLSIVKTLVDLMEGDIEVQSTKGVGTSFIVQLPLKRCEHSACLNPPMRDAAEEEDGREKSTERHTLYRFDTPYRVLIADDSVINRKVLESFLIELGAEVTHAADGREAWNVFQQEAFHFVFLDIQMPLYDGGQVCRMIRRLPDHQIPDLRAVFALTAAHTEAEVAQMGIEVDKSIFDEWVEKPISQDKVMSLLQRYDVRKSIVSEEVALLSSELPQHLQALLPEFIASTQADFEQLFDLLAQNNSLEFKQGLHTLKGGFMMFELKQLVELAKEIEKMNVETDSDKVYQTLSKMQNIFNQWY